MAPKNQPNPAASRKGETNKKSKATVSEKPVEKAPEDILVAITTFLKAYGYTSSSKALVKEEKEQNGRTISTTSKDAAPSLLSIYETWKTSANKADETESSSESSGADSASGSDSASSSEESDDSESESDSDVSMDDAPKLEKKRKSSPSPSTSSSSSSSSSESDSDADDESGPETAPPKSTGTKRKAEDTTQDQQATVKRAKKIEASESSSEDSESSESSDSSSSENESSSEDSSSGSDSESDSGSESDDSKAERKTLKKAAKTPLPESDSSSSSDSEESEDSSSSSSDSSDDESETKETATNDSSDSTATIASSSSKSEDKKSQKTKVDVSFNSIPLPPEPQLKKKHTGARPTRLAAASTLPYEGPSNDYVAYAYAERAYKDLSVTRGKGFTKEKNKKKRGSYRGGPIDIGPSQYSFKFED